MQSTALPLSLDRAAALGNDAGLWAARLFAQERDRWILWLPVALGGGIGIYFELPSEPSLSSAGLFVFIAAVLAYVGRASTFAYVVGLGALAAAIGFGAAKLRTEWATAPVLREAVGPVHVRGRVVEAEPGHKGLRLVLRPATIERARLKALPDRIRITAHVMSGGIRAGDEVAFRAMLFPPPAPAAPGTYDFQRHAFFERIGAVGYALGAIDKTGEATGSALSDAIERLRQGITERIIASLPSPTGALAAAQITGHRHTIPPEVMSAMQDLGLAHLLAISGMNIGIVAGIVFFSVRLLLALFPWLALRVATKKWAAVAALAVSFVYVVISGASVPTQRAFFMLAVVMGGILIDREALSMRLVAWAAVVILLAAPEGLLGPSFQMSFAAVVALIACYERYAIRAPAMEPDTAARRWRRGFLGLALTSLIAGMATAPFAMYSFNRFTTYGLLANLIAVPVTDFWVMPFALLAMLAMTIGARGLAARRHGSWRRRCPLGGAIGCSLARRRCADDGHARLGLAGFRAGRTLARHLAETVALRGLAVHARRPRQHGFLAAARFAHRGRWQRVCGAGPRRRPLHPRPVAPRFHLGDMAKARRRAVSVDLAGRRRNGRRPASLRPPRLPLCQRPPDSRDLARPRRTGRGLLDGATRDCAGVGAHPVPQRHPRHRPVRAADAGQPRDLAPRRPLANFERSRISRRAPMGHHALARS